MLSFKKLRNKRINANDAQAEVSNKWTEVKKAIASSLQRKSETLSTQTKRYSVIVFCLLFGGSSIAVIIHSATTKAQAVSITKISRPAHSMQEKQDYLRNDSSITKREYDRVEQFKNYLFQLKSDSMYSNQFDSITKARPQLIDSINLFEKMYLQQK